MRILYKIDRRGRTSGFSLIELLVVTVIVVVLMALLMPVVSRLRTAGLKATCLNNLRTHYYAVISYANDNNGVIVPYLDYADPKDPKEEDRMHWQRILVVKGYLPAGKTPSGGQANYIPHGLRCPANPNGYMAGERRSGNPDERFKYGTPNYLYNTASGTPMSLSSRDPVPVLRLSQLSSRKAMFFEGREYKPYNQPYRCDYVVNPVAVFFDPDDARYKIADDVHNGSSHVLFWDGHIEAISKEDFRKRKDEIWKYTDWRNE